MFGCLAFASTLLVHHTKFDLRARSCISIGYPIEVKGNKLLDIATKQVLISCDVVFHKDTFPFHSILSHFELIDCFSHIFLPISPSDPFPDSSPHQSHVSHSIESYPATTIGQSPILSIPSQYAHSTFAHSPSQPISPTPPAPIVSPTPPAPIVCLRRSTRPTKTPSYLQDFYCNFSLSTSNSKPNPSPLYLLSDHLSYNSLSLSYKNFVMVVSSHFETQFYHQIVSYPHWCEAKKVELDAIEANNT